MSGRKFHTWDQMNRKQAIDMIGINKVQELEALNCEPTSRAYDHAEGEIEWAASLDTETIPDGEPCTITAYYYTDAADKRTVEDDGGDWGGITWTVSHYTIQ